MNDRQPNAQKAPGPDPAPAMTAPVTAGAPQMPWEAHRARMYQDAVTEAAAAELDETVEGGRFLLPDGTAVDANGEPIKGEKAG